jgi:methylphosphotriester-DNA--protein-cysteine methyltransferase
MRMAVKTPSAPLAAFVDKLWYFEGYETAHSLEHVLPTGTVELVFDLSGRPAVVAGAASRYFLLETARQHCVLGVHFKPGGAFPFFVPPAGELSDQTVDLEAVWGADARQVEEQVLAAPDPDAKFGVVEKALLAAAKGARARRRGASFGPLAHHPAVAFALGELDRTPFADPVAVLAERANLSARRFIAAFRDEVGLTPKLYARVRRFQLVIDHVGQARAVDWAGVAQLCGYFDQAHFIRDFREFSGFTPTQYLARRGEHKNHLPVG